MALNTVSSDRLSTNVKTSNLGTELKKKLGQNKNLIINGAFQVAQRSTSSTTSGYGSVDRFKVEHSATDEAPTHAQVDVASGTTPYTSGFRKALKVTNGNQTSGAGASDYIYIQHNIEAQNIANSGWNYVSASSNIILTFWIKSSVAQSFKVYLRSKDTTEQRYTFDTGSLTADTWTKITKTIPGNSNLVFNNDNGIGVYIIWNLFNGTNRTGTRPLNAWAALDNTSRTPDMTSTWYTTNDATFEITGIQLEVGSVATDFEHRSFGDELQRCKRYYEVLVSGSGKTWGGAAVMYIANQTHHQCTFVEKRSTPTLDYVSGSDYYRYYSNGTNKSSDTLDQFLYVTNKSAGIVANTLSGNLVSGGAAFSYTNNASAFVAISAEL